MEVPHDLARRVPPSGLLGYVNFSDGRPDARFQRSLNDAYAFLATAGDPTPWEALRVWLLGQADALQSSGSTAFRDLAQARAVTEIALGRTLRGYREHHSDLLAGVPDASLFTPLFLARVFEAVLGQGGPWDDQGRVVVGALQKLNDYVGHRPVAVLETRPQNEFYPHERFRPVPLYVRGAGAGHGPYAELIDRALAVLRETDPGILAEAYFDPEALDELASDPRGYDHGHPANRRPNYLFGEWDPHVIDGRGRYRRFVVRQAVLDALLARSGSKDASAVTESAAVLAGTILMASGVSGEGPTTHDSDTRLAILVPRIARYRDAFYARLLERLPGPDGERLRAEAAKLRQPFGGIRQHLNQELARQRSAQMQDRHLALVFADLGYPESSRRQAARIPTASVRMLAEIRLRQSAADLAVGRGDHAHAAALLPEVEDLVERGIACGALADPWNILGYQGLYPLFNAREDSVRDPRNDELIDTVSRQFDLYARLLAGTAASGEDALRKELTRSVRRLAGWWDRFATYEVSDVPRLHGGERADAALHVAQALARHSAEFRGPAGAGARKPELQFWREQREGFTSPAAFAQVIRALLAARDWRSSSALLMTWLSESETVPLADGESSFHRLASRWLDGVLAEAPPDARQGLVRRFFELLEANADRLWAVPSLSGESVRESPDGGGTTYESAYEGVTYRDSTDDGEEGAVLGRSGSRRDFSLEEDARRIEEHLEVLKTVARLWHVAAASGDWAGEGPPESWLRTARAWRRALLELLDREHEVTVPAPAGGQEDVIEFEKRRQIKEGLIEATLAACVEAGRACRTLAALATGSHDADGPDPEWERAAVAVERAIHRRDAAGVREHLPALLAHLTGEPLLFVPPSEGGHPQPVLRARSVLALLSDLLGRLPRLGLVRETYHLVKLAKAMEQNGPSEGRKVSEFDQLFRTALRAVVEALLDAAERSDRSDRPAPPPPDAPPGRPLPPATTFTEVLRKIADSFLTLWVAHSNTLRLSAIEGVGSRDDWDALRQFVGSYGRELFTAPFMTYANLRGILHRGVGAWLDSLADADGPGRPERLLVDLARGRVHRQRANFFLEVTLQAVTEHYEEYKDYNTTTTQSDYGENLHVLLDFLRLKVSHDRFAWRMQPLVLAHETLCRKGYGELAEHWRKSIGESSRELSERLLAELESLESAHAIRLRTVRDRLQGGFVVPLLVDRLCSLVRPAALAARAGQGEDSTPFRELASQLAPFTETPAGVGLDVPPWLHRLEAEVRRLRDADEPPPAPAERGELTLIDLQRQLAEWDKPLAGD